MRAPGSFCAVPRDAPGGDAPGGADAPDGAPPRSASS
jgi:hypothetical protein